jgi:hypothetical protein
MAAYARRHPAATPAAGRFPVFSLRQKAPVADAMSSEPLRRQRCEAKRRNLSGRESLFPITLNCAIFGCFYQP